MRCPHHDLATGPDGRCALCKRRDAGLRRAVARGHDPLRRAAVVVVSLAAGIAALAVLLALADTQPRPRHAAADATHAAASR